MTELMVDFLASQVAQLVKDSARNAGDLGSIPGLERSPEEGKGYPLQYSGLEDSIIPTTVIIDYRGLPWWLRQ